MLTLALAEESRQLLRGVVRLHEGFTDEEGMNPRVAHPCNVSCTENTTLGDDDFFLLSFCYCRTSNFWQQVQRRFQARFESPQIPIIDPHQGGP